MTVAFVLAALLVLAAVEMKLRPVRSLWILLNVHVIKPWEEREAAHLASMTEEEQTEYHADRIRQLTRPWTF